MSRLYLTSRRWALLALTALALCPAAGCGSASPKTYPVKGKVIFKENRKPMKGGLVEFESASDPAMRASGDIQPDGTFYLSTRRDADGAVAGVHRARLEPPLPEPGGRPGVDIHPRFLHFAKSGLKYTVAPGENDFTIEVERPRR